MTEATETPSAPVPKVTFSVAGPPIVAGSVRPISYSALNVQGPLEFTVLESEGGTVHASLHGSSFSYLYHAPHTPGVYHLKCTALYNPAIQATCEVTVVPN